MSIYRHFIKNNWFVKMTLVFASIAVLTILALSYFTYYFISRSFVKDKLEYQHNAMNSVDEFIESKYDSARLILRNVYRDQELSDNISYLLRNSYKDYVEYRLDKYSNSSNSSSKGLNYFKEKLQDDPDIENVILYSTEKQFLFVQDKRNLSKLVSTKAAHSFVPDAMLMATASLSVPNPWVRKAIGQWEPKLFSVQNAINDSTTYHNVGQLIVYYQSEAIKRALANYGDSLPGYILAITPEGNVLFDSSGRYYGEPYPYASEIYSSKGEAELDRPSYVSTITSKNLGYIVAGIAPKAELATETRELLALIVMIGSACAAVAILISAAFVSKFAKRVNRIVRSMRKVENGDMRVRIQDAKEDELGQISRGFNDMLDELTRYIDRVYKAEISQKQTELNALHARVHPHFLYNTLEVIRMRAVSLGANDVGDMIYSLAGLFKSFVQARPVVELKEELDNCRKYLELFRIRYKDKFRYDIRMSPGLGRSPIAGMSLQPLIENYILHGLRTDRQDNEISIQADRREEMLRIVIRDNGKGMDRSKLERIRQGLRVPELSEENGSFGIRSVNERLRLLHGKQFGLEIESELGAGTSITVWFPAREGREGTNESSLSG